MKKYNEEEIRKACENFPTMAQVANNLKMNFNTFRRIAMKIGCYNPNQSGKGIIKVGKRQSLDFITNVILQNKHPMHSFQLKNFLIRFKIKENKCEYCGTSEWMGKEIKCELHHKDGKATNNKLENLIILCPNCHSQTETFRAKNIEKNIVKNKKEYFCSDCKIKISSKAKKCKKCSSIGKGRKVERPDSETLEQEIKVNSFRYLGRKYGVSDNAVRKWCKYYGILK